MKDSELRMIETMLKKQSKLDESVMSAYGLTEIDRENLDMAILDEIGELTHELKGEWCWWKKTQAPVDDEKVLGELVDIWHFVLSYQNQLSKVKRGILMDIEFIVEIVMLFGAYIVAGMIISYIVNDISYLAYDYFWLVTILYPIILPILLYFELKRFVKELKRNAKE